MGAQRQPELFAVRDPALPVLKITKWVPIGSENCPLY